MEPVQISYIVLLAIQAVHLLHHRLAKRHISSVECLTAFVLIYQPSWDRVPEWALLSTHIALGLTQIVGSFWIRPLSPSWDETPRQ